MATRAMDGQVAVITGGGEGIGRAVALALAARGARVVVTGREERALGETVGEIAFGGGKARHVAGDVRDPEHLRAVMRRAVDAFGAIDVVVACAEVTGGAAAAFREALPLMKGPGRLLVVVVDAPADGSPADADDVAARVVALCAGA
jgi:NAD(P)-dependent dehydrogenase (short-subunit alcohol dehydrogenase family)